MDIEEEAQNRSMNIVEEEQQRSMDVEEAPARGTRNRRRSNESLGNLPQFSEAVRKHLRKVYMTLLFAMLASAAGVYLHLYWNIDDKVTLLAGLGCMTVLFYMPSYHVKKRVALLILSALLDGASTRPLINQAIDIDPSILIVATIGVAVAFACFLAAAVGATQRKSLYLSGLLSSGVFILVWLLIAAAFIFGESIAIFEFRLYFGLLVFLGYVVVGTQKTVEKAYHGDMDFVKHAVTLFTNFSATLVRILNNHVELAEEGEENEVGENANVDR